MLSEESLKKSLDSLINVYKDVQNFVEKTNNNTDVSEIQSESIRIRDELDKTINDISSKIDQIYDDMDFKENSIIASDLEIPEINIFSEEERKFENETQNELKSSTSELDDESNMLNV